MVAATATTAPTALPGEDTSQGQPQQMTGLHFPALDGVRALAAGGVFVTHLGLLSGFITNHHTIGPFLARMDVGVSVFFVLSGFLLYRPFVAARFRGESSRPVATYARRRLLRIFPAYWVALVIIAFVLRAPAFEEPHSIVAHFLLLHIYDSTQLIGGPIQQSWTLATELAFYLFVPIWAWLVSRRERDPGSQLKAELIGLAVLLMGSAFGNVVLVVADVQGATFAQLGMWLPFRLTDFVPGMLLAVLSAWISERDMEFPTWLSGLSFSAVCWGLGLLVFWVVSTRLGLPMFPTFTTRQAFAVRVLYLAVAVLFVTPAIVGRQRGGPVQALLGNGVIVWIGLVSYGIYIWHEAWMILYQRWFNEPFLQSSFVRMGLFSAATTVATAALSWYMIEQPAMRLGRSRKVTGA